MVTTQHENGLQRYFKPFKVHLFFHLSKATDILAMDDGCHPPTILDGCIREMKRKVVYVGAKLRVNGEDWSVVTCLFVDDTVLLAESEGDFQRVVKKFCSVCKKQKLKVNDFNKAYRVRMPAVARCRIRLGSEKMEEVSEFKYLGRVL